MEHEQIDIRVSGPKPMRRAALHAIRADLEAVHGYYGEIGEEALVPLPDDPEIDESYEHLRELEDDYGSDYLHRPKGAKRRYPVGELLDGVRREPRLEAVKVAESPKQPLWLLPHNVMGVGACVVGLLVASIFTPPWQALLAAGLTVGLLVGYLIYNRRAEAFYRKSLGYLLGIVGIVVVTGFSVKIGWLGRDAIAYAELVNGFGGWVAIIVVGLAAILVIGDLFPKWLEAQKEKPGSSIGGGG